MLAVPLSDFVEHLNKDVVVKHVTTEGLYVVIDDLFASNADHHLIDEIKQYGRFSNGHDLISKGWHSHQSECAFAGIIAHMAGIVRPEFYEDSLPGYWHDGVRFLPPGIFEIEEQKSGVRLVLVCPDPEYQSSAFVKIVSTLGRIGEIKVIPTPATFDENGNPVFPASCPCLKSALELLIRLGDEALEAARHPSDAREKICACDWWVKFLINAFLKQNGSQDEIDIVSNNTDDMVDLGNMVDNMRYLAFGYSSYDEDGWDDPRTNDPKGFAKAKRILFGPGNKKRFEKYSFQSGG